MTLGVPVPNASPYLAHKIEAALVGQVSEIANQICNGMLIARTTMLLESCNRVGGPGYVANFVDHTNKPTMMRRFVFDGWIQRIDATPFHFKLAHRNGMHTKGMQGRDSRQSRG
jgi:hypothetical protein